MSNLKETFNPVDHTLRDVFSDAALFDSYYRFVSGKYLGKIQQGDVKSPQAWKAEDLRKDLHFSELRPQAQDIFDDLVTGDLTDIWKSYRLFEITATEEQVAAMKVEQLREIAINRTAVGLAAKIYLARFIDKKNLRGALKNRGDICPSYWNVVGNAYTLVDIARTGFNEWKTPHNFTYALENHIYSIQTADL